MTQPKFPWVLLVIVAMFTFIAISPVTPPWMVVLAIISVLVTAAAAVYQVIPRKDPFFVDPITDPEAADDVPDQWSDPPS